MYVCMNVAASCGGLRHTIVTRINMYSFLVVSSWFVLCENAKLYLRSGCFQKSAFKSLKYYIFLQQLVKVVVVVVVVVIYKYIDCFFLSFGHKLNGLITMSWLINTFVITCSRVSIVLCSSCCGVYIILYIGMPW